MHFEEKNDFFLYFWIIFVEAPSENVLLWQQEKVCPLVLVSKHHLHIFMKVTKFQEKIFCCFRVMLQKPQGGGGGGGWGEHG